MICSIFSLLWKQLAFCICTNTRVNIFHNMVNFSMLELFQQVFRKQLMIMLLHKCFNTAVKIELRIDIWSLHVYYDMPNVTFVCIFEQGNQMTGSIDSRYDLNGMMFSTLDRDNDICYHHCVFYVKGGWWFNCCSYAHLNGLYNMSSWWNSWYPTVTTGTMIQKTSMMIRRR